MELRATVNLGRLWQRQSKDKEARHIGECELMVDGQTLLGRMGLLSSQSFGRILPCVAGWAAASTASTGG